jgi:hypothetical protein
MWKVCFRPRPLAPHDIEICNYDLMAVIMKPSMRHVRAILRKSAYVQEVNTNVLNEKTMGGII